MNRLRRFPVTPFAVVLCATVIVCAPLSRASGQSVKPLEPMSNSARSLRDSVVHMAKRQLGRRYRTGGQTPERGFDCSGLVHYVMSALNVGLPRTARQQAGVGLALRRDTTELLPGDLLTFARTKRGVSHIGIYIGGGKFIHASSGTGRVIESSIDRRNSSLSSIWRGARRVLSLDDSASAATPATTLGRIGAQQ